MVIKLHASENGLPPPMFFALTRQKYVVLAESELSVYDVPVKVESSTRVDPNAELVETCKRYESAPVEIFQVTANVRG